MERKKFLKQNSQNKWQKRGLEDNYFKLPFSQNILPKILRIFAKNVECAQNDVIFKLYGETEFSLHEIEQLADLFGCSLDYLVGHRVVTRAYTPGEGIDSIMRG